METAKISMVVRGSVGGRGDKWVKHRRFFMAMKIFCTILLWWIHIVTYL